MSFYLLFYPLLILFHQETELVFAQLLIFKAQGDLEKALSYLKQSLTISQQIGDKKGEGSTLNNISQVYDAQGDYETALSYLKQSLAISQQIGDKASEGIALGNISSNYAVRGDYETALSYLKESLTILQQIGDKAGESTMLNNFWHGSKRLKKWTEDLYKLGNEMLSDSNKAIPAERVV